MRRCSKIRDKDGLWKHCRIMYFQWRIRLENVGNIPSGNIFNATIMVREKTKGDGPTMVTASENLRKIIDFEMEFNKKLRALEEGTKKGKK